MKKFLWLFLLIPTACAYSGPFGSSPESSQYSFTIEFPEQWRKVNTSRFLMITRDGPFSQYILAQQRHVERPFRHTKKKMNEGMLPQEAAGVIIDEIISDRSVLNFKVIENLPATVNEYDGFRLVFTYETRDGLRFKTVYYGFLEGKWFYNLRYNAAQRHYSEMDLSTFEEVLKSFKIKKGPRPA